VASLIIFWLWSGRWVVGECNTLPFVVRKTFTSVVKALNPDVKRLSENFPWD